MKIYSGNTNGGRIREGDIHYYHCGGRQEQMKNMTNAEAKALRHKERQEYRIQVEEELDEEIQDHIPHLR